jgi:hypothetical protein
MEYLSLYRGLLDEYEIAIASQFDETKNAVDFQTEATLVLLDCVPVLLYSFSPIYLELEELRRDAQKDAVSHNGDAVTCTM